MLFSAFRIVICNGEFAKYDGDSLCNYEDETNTDVLDTFSVVRADSIDSLSMDYTTQTGKKD